LSRFPERQQRQVLGGGTTAELASLLAGRAAGSTDIGAVALAAWAAAEVAGEYATTLFDALHLVVHRGAPIATVDLSWALTAAVAARHIADTDGLARQIARSLRDAQGPAGTFPHVLPPKSQRRYRAHVGCFADQVYPIQALSRFFAAFQDPAALVAADRCAERICALQGPAGQWWWHYDVRDGSVVEGYPVYSVHQHAMGPMALRELAAAGGVDHGQSVARGVQWLSRHPEVMGELVHEPLGVIWRKVGRREVRKAARAVAAVTTSVRPGLRLPGIDLVCPPRRIDYECRPYELGWLLYAWGPDRVAEPVRAPGARDD
jgi:hypothetical protein